MRTFIFATAIAVSSAAAEAAIFGFESGVNGGAVPTEFQGGITLLNVVGTRGGAVIFDTRDAANGAPPVDDPDLLAPFRQTNGTGATDPGNVVTVFEGGRSTPPDDHRRGGTLTFMFDRMVRFVGIDVFDLERKKDLLVQIDGVIVAAGGQSQDRGVTRLFGDGLAAGGSAISVVSSTSFAVDNLEVAAVPVPAALPAMLGALGSLGLLARRRRG